MEIPSSFFIVAPQTGLSWSYSTSLTESELCPFRFKDGRLIGEGGRALSIADGDITFVSDDTKASNIVLEPTSITTNFKIKYREQYIIRKGNALVFGDGTENKMNVESSKKKTSGEVEEEISSVWIFVPSEIDETHTFVVARYSEDASWVRFLPGRVILYNKGKDNIQFEMRENMRIERLENVGREGHTYLSHIIQNYDNLTGRTTFLQANPFAHSENILEICCMGGDMADFQAISMYYLPELPRKDIVEKYCKRLNGAGHTLFPVDKFGQFFDYCDAWWRPASDAYALGKNPLSVFLESVGMGHKKREIYLFCMAALFSVRRENILLNTREAYENIRAELIRRNQQGGFDGYILERLWHTILTDEGSAYKVEGELIPALFGQKDICYYKNNKYTTLAAYEGDASLPLTPCSVDGGARRPLFKHFKLVPYPRFIFPDSEFINHIKNYASILSHQLHRRGPEFTIMANLGCKFVDEGAAIEKRLTKYFEYLVHHVGEWDLFLGAPKNVNPVRIVCEDPCIIECCYATDLTFAIHSQTSVRIIQEYSVDSSNYTKNLDLALIDGIINSERIIGRRPGIWIPYPVLCENADEGDGGYVARMNEELATFIKRAKERKPHVI
jgi:hypothetical protein